MSNRLKKKVPDHQKRLQLLKQIHFESHRSKLHPELVLAVIDVESNFNRYAISRVGATGLMQVMPFWLKEIGRPGDNLFNIRTNLRMGCTILKILPRQRERQSDKGINALQRQPGELPLYQQGV